ncbi:MAG TPA: type II toxin-antitoxin system VapC family toxin [Acidobacteriaceae bacterium]|nr:type II toxin-antitoxin system VapC family toxin [Acidobacteriaceae bacterium]
MILADSDVLIDYLSGVQPVQDQVARYIGSDRLRTTAISCFEILSGASEDRRGDPARRLVESVNVLPLDRAAAERAAAFRRDLDRSGQSIGMADSLIAGIALAHDLPLFTRNQKRFLRVPGLSLVEAQNDR